MTRRRPFPRGSPKDQLYFLAGAPLHSNSDHQDALILVKDFYKPSLATGILEKGASQVINSFLRMQAAVCLPGKS